MPDSTDAATHFDARTQTLNIANSNTGVFGAAKRVGIDGLAVNPINRPDVWLNCSDIPDAAGSDYCMTIDAADNSVRGMGFYGALTGTFPFPSSPLYIASSGVALVENNAFGVFPDGSEPAWAKQNRRMGFLAEGKASVKNNYFAYNGYGAVFNLASSRGSVFSGNYLEHNGPNVDYGVAAGAADGDSVSVWDASSVLIEGNYIVDSRKRNVAAMDLGKLVEISNAQATIQNNTLHNGYTANIGVYNGSLATSINRNIISGAAGTGSGQTGPGVIVNPAGSVPSAVTISRNSIYNNHGLAIDLDSTPWNNGDGVTLNDANDTDAGPNGLINFPQFSLITITNGNLVLSGCAPAGAKVELFEADISATSNSGASAGDNRFGRNQDYGEGEVFLTDWVMPASGAACTLSIDGDGNNSTGMLAFNQTIALTSLAAGSSVGVDDKLTATATVANTGTSEFSAVSAVVGFNVSGRVFNDVNVSAATDSNEEGISQLPIVLYNTVDKTCVSTQTNGSGEYIFSSVVAGTYQVYEASGETVPVPNNCGPAFAKDPSGYRSTTNNVRAKFTVVSSNITGQDFGDVKPPVFEPDHTGQVLAGNVLFYAHKFETPTKGSVTFDSVSSGSASAGWSSVIYQDANCDGALNESDGVSPVSGSLAVDPDGSICLINKVYAPSNVAANDRYIQDITATFDYSNTIAGTQTLSVKDVTTVQQPVEAGVGDSRLEIRKTVKNITQATAETATINAAKQGDTLEYRVYYRNSGTEPVTDLVINDKVPPFTHLIGAASCGVELSGMTCIASPLSLDGSLMWTFTGPLVGGSESSVSFRVLVDE